MKAKALVLEKQRELSLRDIDLPDQLGPNDVRIRIHTVGICGSDVHYYTHFEKMDSGLKNVAESGQIIGHEFAGIVAALGPVRVLPQRRCGRGRGPGRGGRAPDRGVLWGRWCSEVIFMGCNFILSAQPHRVPSY